jgi:hypothetical protein
VSEYLTYILWRQREHTLPRELERQRVAEERLTHQRHSRMEQVRPEPARLPDASAEAAAEPSVTVADADLEPVN